MTGYEIGSDYRWKSGFVQVTGFNNFIRNAVATYKLSGASNADIDLAKQLERAGAHILGIKDMAGLCRPAAARQLISALKNGCGVALPHSFGETLSGVSFR